MKKHKPIPPMGISINDPLWKRVVRKSLTVLGSLLCAAALLVLLLEAAVGCGESYVDSKGVTHVNECLFINRGESK
jgi:hypothetical protein